MFVHSLVRSFALSTFSHFWVAATTVAHSFRSNSSGPGRNQWYNFIFQFCVWVLLAIHLVYFAAPQMALSFDKFCGDEVDGSLRRHINPSSLKFSSQHTGCDVRCMQFPTTIQSIRWIAGFACFVFITWKHFRFSPRRWINRKQI